MEVACYLCGVVRPCRTYSVVFANETTGAVCGAKINDKCYVRHSDAAVHVCKRCLLVRTLPYLVAAVSVIVACTFGVANLASSGSGSAFLGVLALGALGFGALVVVLGEIIPLMAGVENKVLFWLLGHRLSYGEFPPVVVFSESLWERHTIGGPLRRGLLRRIDVSLQRWQANTRLRRALLRLPVATDLVPDGAVHMSLAEALDFLRVDSEWQYTMLSGALTLFRRHDERWFISDDPSFRSVSSRRWVGQWCVENTAWRIAEDSFAGLAPSSLDRE